LSSIVGYRKLLSGTIRIEVLRYALNATEATVIVISKN